jgi:hypothetical protein
VSWREQHRRKVGELEAAATEVVLGQLEGIVQRITAGFAATTSAAGDEPADATGSLDDLSAVRPMWATSVDGVIVPWFAEVFAAGGAAAVEQIASLLDRTVPPADPDLVNEAAQWFLAQARPRFVQLGDDMAARAQSEILDSFRAGESIAETRRRLRSVTDLSRADAEMVARTQVIAASNAGGAARTQLMPDEVRPRYQVWMATMDSRTRATHVAADGQAVPVGELFTVGASSMAYPGDPTGSASETANCRCTQIYSDEAALPDVDGRQRGRTGGIVDRTQVPAASAIPLVVRSGQQLVEQHWRDAAGKLHTEMGLVAASGWAPPEDAYCIEDGCHEPATTRRPLTENIDGLVCALHSGRDLAAANIDSVTGEVHTGSMIALLPSEADAERMALEGGESVEQLHVTLWFLGEADDMPESLRHAIRHEIEDRAANYQPIDARVFGAAVWNPNGQRGGSLNWNVGADLVDDQLSEIRADMHQGVYNAPDWVEDDHEAAKAWEMPDNHTPWAAHMCAMYAETDQLSAALPAALDRVGEITLDRVRLTFGPAVIDIPLGDGQPAASATEEEGAMPDSTTSSRDAAQDAAVVGRRAGEAFTGALEERRIRSDMRIETAAAPKPPPGKKVKAAPNGQCPPGYRPDPDNEGGCIASSTPAKGDSDAAAPFPPPDGPGEEDGCPPGQHMVDGECVPMDDEPDDDAASERVKPPPLPGEHFRATMHIQNVSTGKRTFKNLTWREPPFAFHRQRNSSAHGGIPEVVQTGLVSRVVQDGDTLYGFGPLDLDSDDGLEHARRLVMGFERWVSIGLDEQPSNIEVVWPDTEEDDDGNPMSAVLMEPDQIIFDGGRIGELTSVSVPAQDEATVEPTPELIRVMEQRMGQTAPDAAKVVTAAVVGSTDLPVADRDRAWDAAGATNRVFEWATSGDRVDTARVARAFLYRDPNGDAQTKAAWKLGFADVIDGQLRIVPRGVQATAGGRGVNRAQIPEDEKARIRSKICTLYGKVRNVHDDWPDCPFGGSDASQAVGHAYEMADTVQAVTAAAYRIEIQELPPRWWYDEPTDVEVTSALNITEDGRLYGKLAPLGTGHRAFANSGRRLEAPFGNVDYDRFMGAWALTSKGKIAAGPITMECGHADRFRTDHDVAPAHYENSCTVFATIRVGESRRGGYVWVAGALQPGVTPDLVSRALACRLSGDWQPHPDKAGWQELIAALLVPSPGFGSTHQQGPSLSVGDEIAHLDGALVASSVHAEVPVRAVALARPTLRVDPVNHRVARVEA